MKENKTSFPEQTALALGDQETMPDQMQGCSWQIWCDTQVEEKTNLDLYT